MRNAAITIALATLAGCAMSPKEVAETEAMQLASLRAGVAAAANCMQHGMDEIASAWHTSLLMDRDGAGAAVRIHGVADTGTMAVARLRRNGEVTRVSVHVSTSIFPREPLAEKIRLIAEGCDTP